MVLYLVNSIENMVCDFFDECMYVI